MDSISIKRSITVRAVVTPSWKEEAERELSNAISAIDQQLGELEKEGQQIVDGIRRQSSNPLDPRVQEQVAHCLLYTSPSPRDGLLSRMPSSA